MYTQAEICNLALDRIGTTEVLKSLGDNTIECEVCLRELPGALTKVLSMYPWTFARKRAQLARVADSPEFGFAYRYRLPVDFLALVRLEDFPADGRFAIESGHILCDAEKVKIIYTTNTVSCADIPAHVAELVVLELARRIATPLKSNARGDVQAFLQQLWQDAYPCAMSTEIHQIHPRRKNNSWLNGI